MNIIKKYRYHSKVELETIANRLRLEVETKRKRRMKAESVAEDIADFLELNVIWNSIPADNKGNIAAMIIPVKKIIYINEDIEKLKGGFGQSTIAHEIGHWMLHINQDAVGEYIDREEQGMTIKVEPFLCRSVTSLGGIEWQAQYFAGCLLMSYYKLVEAKIGRDVTRRQHLYAMADEFGVTISNLTYRLQDLKWIHLPEGSKQIYPGENLPQ